MRKIILMISLILSSTSFAGPALNCVCSSYSPSTEADGRASATIHRLLPLWRMQTSLRKAWNK